MTVSGRGYPWHTSSLGLGVRTITIRRAVRRRTVVEHPGHGEPTTEITANGTSTTPNGTPDVPHVR